VRRAVLAAIASGAESRRGAEQFAPESIHVIAVPALENKTDELPDRAEIDSSDGA